MRTRILAAALLLTPLAIQDGARPARAQAGPEVGKPIPLLRLNDHTGTATRLGGKGKAWTVLAFYPKAATPG